MKHYRIFLVLCALFLILLTTETSRAQTPLASDISFTVSMSKPWTHLLEVEMRVQIPANLNVPNETDLSMPVWTPGSYMVREFERHVQEFAADAGGRALPWNKIDKSTWRVTTGGARQWRATYRVYANEFTVRTNDLNADHAFWNNAALLMYPAGKLSSASTVRVVPPSGWNVASALPAVPGQANTFRAENFDILYDSPFEAGKFKQIIFQVRGVPHRIVIDGEGNYDPDRMRADVQKIVETEVDMFGSIPYRDYTFFLHLRTTGGGGIEHLNSTSLGFRRFGFSNDNGYKNFAALVAHEFFHLWNVKRIRPEPLGPFDYSKENYSRLLWVAEGVTEYYGWISLRRAGLISDRAFLDHVSDQIDAIQKTPGRLQMSAEEASFDAWIKEYRPDENSSNSSISYYDKGEMLGLLLDLEIRHRSNNAKSLDDVMRYLYHEFFEKNRNYTSADFQKVCEQMAGSSLESFFARYVRGREELPYEEVLAAAGLRLVKPQNGNAPQQSYLGVELGDSGGFPIVQSVLAGTPAYDQGLNARDLIIGLNGVRVTRTLFDSLIAAKRPGETVHLTIFREDNLRTLDITLGSRPVAGYRIVLLPSPSAQQKQIYDSWLNVKR